MQVMLTDDNGELLGAVVLTKPEWFEALSDGALARELLLQLDSGEVVLRRLNGR